MNTHTAEEIKAGLNIKTSIIQRLKRIFYIFSSSITHPLIKGSKILYFFNFLVKFIKLHIERNFLKKKDLIIPWINDAKFILRKTDVPLLYNVYWGVSEYPDMIFLAHCLKENNMFIDCGANVGTYSIIASKVVGANSITFEPNPHTITKLNQNIELNNLEKKVDIRKVALSDKIGNLYFSNYGDTDDVLNRVSLNQSSSSTNILVKSSTLDDEINIKEDFILKIDVEGYENKLIKGAKKLLANENLLALIIEVNHKIDDYEEENREDLHNILSNYGLIPINYDPFKRIVSRKIKDFTNLKANNLSPNTIYIKNFEEVNNLVKDAKKIKIHNSFCQEL